MVTRTQRWPRTLQCCRTLPVLTTDSQSCPDGSQGRVLRAVTGRDVQCPQGLGTAGKVWPLPDSHAAASAPSLTNRCFHKSQTPHPARPSSSFSRDRDGSPATPTRPPLFPERSLTARPATRGASAAASVLPTPDGRRSPTGEAAQRGPRAHAAIRQSGAEPRGAQGRGDGLRAGGSVRPRHGRGSAAPRGGGAARAREQGRGPRQVGAGSRAEATGRHGALRGGGAAEGGQSSARRRAHGATYRTREREAGPGAEGKEGGGAGSEPCGPALAPLRVCEGGSRREAGRPRHRPRRAVS